MSLLTKTPWFSVAPLIPEHFTVTAKETSHPPREVEQYYCPHFTDGETEAWRGRATCPGLPSGLVAQPWPSSPRRGSAVLPPCMAKDATAKGKRNWLLSPWNLIEKHPRNDFSLGTSIKSISALSAELQREGRGQHKAREGSRDGGLRRSPPAPRGGPARGQSRGEMRHLTLPRASSDPGTRPAPPAQPGACH